MFKRIVSLCMAVVLMMTMLPVTTKAEENTTEADMSAVTVEGGNSLGTLLGESIQEAYEAEMEPGAYSIMGIEIAGNTAVVEYGCVEEAIVVVALYSEENSQMLCSAKAEADPDASEVTVTFDGEMPEYFLTSVYMVDKYDYSPLCAAYETPMYTQEMQELMSSTIEDYDAERVLNLDDDPTTNFAVYAEDTIVIEEQAGVNTVASADTENAVYVIENADESITSLQEGDVFVYPYGEEILIVKVASVSVDGTTVTITGTDLEIEEAFSHMKIEGTGTTADAVVDPDSGDEGVTYEGLSDGTETAAYSARTSAEGTVGTSVKFDLDMLKDSVGNGSCKLSGSLELSLEVTVTFHITPRYQHADICIEAGFTGTISVSAGLEVQIKLPGISIPAITGVLSVNFKSYFVVEFEGSASITYECKTAIGFYITHNKSGWKSKGYSKPSKPSWNLEQSGKMFIGLKLGPTIELGPLGCLAEFSVETSIGFEASLSRDAETLLSKDIKHECEECYSGDIKAKRVLGVSLKFLKLDKLGLSADLLESSSKICNIYYCKDHDEFELSDCPYVRHRVKVVISDAAGNLLPGITVYAGAETADTNEKGVAFLFLPVGEHTIRAVVDNETIQYTTYVAKAQKINLKLDQQYPDRTVGGIIGTITEETVTEETVADSEVIASGTCGDALTWTLDGDGLLTISGTGAMYNYYEYDVPWCDFRENIVSVAISDGVTSIGDCAFFECGGLVTVTIPDGVTTIGGKAFNRCYRLVSITLPEGVTAIYQDAFRDCINLTNITIPAGVELIRWCAFEGCQKLTSITIPKEVTSIDSSAFRGCISMREIWVDPQNQNYASDETGILFNKDFTKVIYYPTAKTGGYSIPQGVTSIGDYAFWGCDGLTSIAIPDGVTYIGNSAFYECSNLTSVLIPEGVIFIGEDSFAYCHKLSNITIPEGITSLKYGVFRYCQSLDSITIPEGVTSIGNAAFGACDNLTDIVIPESVVSIDAYAFSNCNSLRDVYYGGSEEQWNTVTIKESNESLTGATFHYNSTGLPAVLSLEVDSVQTEVQKENVEAVSAIPEISQEAEKLEAVYGGEYSSETVDSYTLKTASFSGLVPGEEYLLLSLVSLDAADHLAGENLLYVDQAPAESDGTLVFQYVQREDSDVSYVMVCGASNQNLTDAEINFPQMYATESEAAVDPTVTYDGKILTEGVDYILLGDVTYTEAGQYSCFLRGIHNYTGLVECTYTVEDQETPDDTPDETPDDVPDDIPAVNPFTDVHEGDWYYDPVLWAVEEGITKGYGSDTTFCPDIECSRAQVVTFLWRAKGSPAPSSSENPFRDVPNGEWYSEAVLWAVEQGITQGYGSSDTFNPNGICTRAQVVTFLQRCFGGEASSDSNPFIDVPNGEWYTTAVLWAVEEGITNGYGGNDTFAPNLNCTRGQIVTFLYRAMNG